ncbi:flagellar protein FliT [Pistricoccus aurantiacus]|uniref:flagellar protein FliT n=1 Tax=Pistricoccus aurantiacus TaxID=1883414 RepID=UPI003639BF2A
MMNLSHAPIETPKQVVEYYEALLARSGRMLQAAREGDWETLLDEQSHYVIEIDRLSQYEPELELDESCRDSKSALVERILEQDVELRQLLEAKRDALGEMIGSSQRKRDLGKAYQSGSRVVDASERFVATLSAGHTAR